VLAADSLTVKTALTATPVPSVTVTSLILRDGIGAGSSSRMRPWPCARAIGAPTALSSLTMKPSCGSGIVSPLTVTVIVFRVSPGAKVSRPLAAT
jgi:hypothetical protein